MTPEELWYKIEAVCDKATDREIRLPTGEVKKCLEEWLPIYLYCINIRRLGLRLDIDLSHPGEYPDAVVCIEGFVEKVINVEVGFVKNYEDALRNELLDETGTCPGFGSIVRDKKTKEIRAEIGAYSGGALAAKTYRDIADLVKKKSEKGYSEQTDLIIAYRCHDSSRYPPNAEQVAVIKELRRPPICRVICINLENNQVWTV
jgi:hypothetical protein